MEYKLTTEHAASSYNQPVLVDSDNNAYGPMDKLPDGREAGVEILRLMIADCGIAVTRIAGLAAAPSLHNYLAGKTKTITFETYSRVIAQLEK